jgi:triosephosphate isomerase
LRASANKSEREAKRTLDVIGRQLDGSLPDGVTAENLVVAYEPVWAIGTGLRRRRPMSPQYINLSASD